MQITMFTGNCILTKEGIAMGILSGLFSKPKVKTTAFRR